MVNENWVKKETLKKHKEDALSLSNKYKEAIKGKTPVVTKHPTAPRAVIITYKE